MWPVVTYKRDLTRWGRHELLAKRRGTVTMSSSQTAQRQLTRTFLSFKIQTGFSCILYTVLPCWYISTVMKSTSIEFKFNWIQIQFNSNSIQIQFNSIQFNSIQFNFKSKSHSHSFPIPIPTPTRFPFPFPFHSISFPFQIPFKFRPISWEQAPYGLNLKDTPTPVLTQPPHVHSYYYRTYRKRCIPGEGSVRALAAPNELLLLPSVHLLSPTYWCSAEAV